MDSYTCEACSRPMADEKRRTTERRRTFAKSSIYIVRTISQEYDPQLPIEILIANMLCMVNVVVRR